MKMELSRVCTHVQLKKYQDETDTNTHKLVENLKTMRQKRNDLLKSFFLLFNLEEKGDKRYRDKTDWTNRSLFFTLFQFILN